MPNPMRQKAVEGLKVSALLTTMRSERCNLRRELFSVIRGIPSFL